MAIVVKDLIAKLRTMDEDATVVVAFDERGALLDEVEARDFICNANDEIPDYEDKITRDDCECDPSEDCVEASCPYIDQNIVVLSASLDTEDDDD